MPTNKDFKRLIRARMGKTGEAYTAARANLLKRWPTTGRISAPAEPAAPVAVAPVAPANFAKLAGMTDASIKKATGCTWESWVHALDYVRAYEWSHRAIAEYVNDKFKTGDWWTQTVTVGYERIKGLRAIGQRRDGGYEATKSKSIAAPASAVFKAFADGRQRKKWLPESNIVVRHARPNRSVRMNWPDGTSVEVGLIAKGKKTITAVTHRKLTGKEDAERRKDYWAEKLGLLSESLA